MAAKTFRGSYQHIIEDNVRKESYTVNYVAGVYTSYDRDDDNRYELDVYESVIRNTDGVNIVNDLELFGSIDYFEDMTFADMRANDPYDVETERERLYSGPTVFQSMYDLFKP